MTDESSLTKGSLPVSLRASRPDTLLVVAIALLLAASPLLPRNGVIGVEVAVALLVVIGWFGRCPAAVPLGTFCAVTVGLALSGVPFSQLTLGLGLAVYTGLVRAVPWLRASISWMRVGTFGWDVRLLSLACGLAAAIVLACWFVVLRPNVDDLIERFLPDLPLVLLVLGGLLFSMINAAVEEGAYRGVLMHALELSLGPGLASLVLQAVAFGTLHINGFPRGWIGVGLAFVYGLLMGLVRRQSAGMLAPWIAHVFTDVAIVTILLFLARR